MGPVRRPIISTARTVDGVTTGLYAAAGE